MIPQSSAEYRDRDAAAAKRLRERNLLAPALAWLKRHEPPDSWQGTHLEYAETEMPTWPTLLRRLFFCR